MFLQRAIVSFTLGPLLLILTYYGGWLFFAGIALLLTVSSLEYSRITANMGHRVPLAILIPAVWAQMLIAHLAEKSTTYDSFGLAAFALFLSLGAAVIYVLFQYERRDQTKTRGVERFIFDNWLAITGGILFIGWLGSHFLRLRALDPAIGSEAFKWTTLAFLATWGSDTGAYGVGKFVAGRFGFGRHHITPRLSPKKTLEGYIGGIIFGTLLTTMVGIYLLDLNPTFVILIALLIGFLGTAGDLFVSLLKREANVKDSGKLFPGHGGALDRVDSLIWSFAIIYYLLYANSLLSQTTLFP